MKITDIANVRESVVMVTPTGFLVMWEDMRLVYADNSASYAPSPKDINGDWRLEWEPPEKTVTITKEQFIDALNCGSLSDALQRLGFE